jgi:hypothetical protein
LLGIDAGAAATTEFFGSAKFYVYGAIQSSGMAVPATGGAGGGMVKNLYRHGDFLSMNF